MRPAQYLIIIIIIINLQRLLQQARESNLKLNKKKLRLRLEEVAYMGHLLTSKGIRPDPMKVQVIQALPQPNNKRASGMC